MAPEEALTVFRQHEQMRRVVSFVVIDDDGLLATAVG